MPAPHRQPLPQALQQLLGQLAQLNAERLKQGLEFTPIGMRENLDLMTRRFVSQIPQVPLTRDTLVHGRGPGDFAVPVRIYHPDPQQALPILVFAHGGGHMAGSVSVYDGIARKLALASNRLLVSVDYRLSPECPYPLGLNDLKQVITGVYATLDRLGMAHDGRLAVAGDSGGGAITASAVHQLADRTDTAIEHQVLIYPSLDYTLSSPSIDELAEGHLLERKRIEWLFDQYLQHAEDRYQTSPLFMPVPIRYPRTLVVSAGYCPLRDENLAYVERLTAAGRSAQNLHFPDMIHAFLNLEDLVTDACTRCYAAIGRFLNEK